jgi:hypothetical protein
MRQAFVIAEALGFIQERANRIKYLQERRDGGSVE